MLILVGSSTRERSGDLIRTLSNNTVTHDGVLEIMAFVMKHSKLALPLQVPVILYSCMKNQITGLSGNKPLNPVKSQ